MVQDSAHVYQYDTSQRVMLACIVGMTDASQSSDTGAHTG